MDTRILVIHGVANPTYDTFDTVVNDLAAGLPHDWTLIRGFWGDIGASARDIEQVVPTRQTSFRAAPDGSLDAPMEALPGQLAADPTGSLGPTEGGLSHGEVRALGLAVLALAPGPLAAEALIGTTPAEVITAAAIGRLAELGVAKDDAVVRSGVDAALAAHPLAGVVASEDSLRGFGIAIAERYTGQVAAPAAAPLVEGGRAGFAGLPEFDPFGAIDDVIKAAHDLIGDFVDDVGGAINEGARKWLLKAMGTGIGDLVVYQAHQTAIQNRIWECIDSEAPGMGTPDTPIPVLAHSLGGIIAWDMALRSKRPLSIDPLITFGSQSAVLEIYDPRERWRKEGSFKGQPLELPRQIRRWLNLWDPIDPLAFSAAHVFKTAEPNGVRDVYLPYTIEKGVFSHTSYWKDPVLHAVVKSAMESDT